MVIELNYTPDEMAAFLRKVGGYYVVKNVGIIHVRRSFTDDKLLELKSTFEKEFSKALLEQFISC